ncbi:hypothetical protein Rhal01_03390 [Rubritalea halochordaticola]|uniref:DUF1573 domain-containing protein n=1 Tax=Rubritalea halochordaticola TaxID=714537 RepID=A0ABP9V9A8_9BACT
MHLLFLLLLYSAVLLFPARVNANLTFDSKLKEFTVKPGLKSLKVTFNFKNTSGKEIKISKLEAPCTCLSAHLKDNKKSYSPGDTGEIVANFSVDSFYGTISKNIMVWIEGDPKLQPSIKLTTQVTIPSVVELSSTNLSWKTDEESNTKTFKVTINQTDPVLLKNITCSNEQFKVSYKVLTEGKLYEVAVTPLNTSTPGFGILRIKTDSKLSRFKSLRAYVSIRK